MEAQVACCHLLVNDNTVLMGCMHFSWRLDCAWFVLCVKPHFCHEVVFDSPSLDLMHAISLET